MSTKPVWILGATGRSARVAITELVKRRIIPAVLVGRDADALHSLAHSIEPAPRTVIVKSVEELTAELQRCTEAVVVVNTVGPFTETAVSIIRASPAGSDYVDITNELDAVLAVLAMSEMAVSGGRCLVTAAGWGVFGTESIALKLCEGRPPAAKVRVDMLPFVSQSRATAVGDALAGTIIEAAVAGGRRYEGGRLVPSAVGAEYEELTLPDGSKAASAAVPLGELEAARRATGAESAVSCSSMAPTSAFIRWMLPAVAAALAWKPLRGWARARLAAVVIQPKNEAPRSSFARARVEWSDGTVREGWLRAPEGTAFTGAVIAEVTARLARREGRPGAFTPGALCGADMALAAGGEFLL